MSSFPPAPGHRQIPTADQDEAASRASAAPRTKRQGAAFRIPRRHGASWPAPDEIAGLDEGCRRKGLAPIIMHSSATAWSWAGRKRPQPDGKRNDAAFEPQDGVRRRPPTFPAVSRRKTVLAGPRRATGRRPVRRGACRVAEERHHGRRPAPPLGGNRDVGCRLPGRHGSRPAEFESRRVAAAGQANASLVGRGDGPQAHPGSSCRSTEPPGRSPKELLCAPRKCIFANGLLLRPHRWSCWRGRRRSPNRARDRERLAAAGLALATGAIPAEAGGRFGRIERKLRICGHRVTYYCPPARKRRRRSNTTDVGLDGTQRNARLGSDFLVIKPGRRPAPPVGAAPVEAADGGMRATAAPPRGMSWGFAAIGFRRPRPVRSSVLRCTRPVPPAAGRRGRGCEAMVIARPWRCRGLHRRRRLARPARRCPRQPPQTSWTLRDAREAQPVQTRPTRAS